MAAIGLILLAQTFKSCWMFSESMHSCILANFARSWTLVYHSYITLKSLGIMETVPQPDNQHKLSTLIFQNTFDKNEY